ncbi:hypothetical protein [Syntrophomonas erecta]
MGKEKYIRHPVLISLQFIYIAVEEWIWPILQRLYLALRYMFCGS